VTTLAWLLFAVGAGYSASMLGYPDAHLTELDRARALLYPTAALGALLGAVLTVTLARRAPWTAPLAFVLLLGATLATDTVLAGILDHGGGG
jgi:hypothetical protein